MSRFLTVLAGLTAAFSISLIPHFAQAANECGPPASNAAICSDAAYGGTSATPDPIEYKDQTGGLTLTVKPSGEMTTIKSFLPPDDDTRYSGITVVGDTALVVKLEGKVRIVNEAGGWASPTEGTFDNDGTKVSATFIDPQYQRGSQNYGIYVLNEKVGDTNREDKIEIVVGADTKIGTKDVPVGHTGVRAEYSSSFTKNLILFATNPKSATAQGDVSIVNRGEIYGYYEGIKVLHQGSGTVTVETAEDSVTSKGISVALVNGGDVTITNHGTIINERQRPLYAKTLPESGDATLDNADNEYSEDDEGQPATLFNHHGIVVGVTDLFGVGTAEEASSEITITSSGDITAYEHGIAVVTSGGSAGTSVAPVTIDVTGGVITAGWNAEGEAGARNAINVLYGPLATAHKGGLIKVDFAGKVAGAKSDGIYIDRSATPDAQRDIGDNNRDIKVTLKSGARIGMDGDEPTVGRDGVSIKNKSHGATIHVVVESGAMIGTMKTPVGQHGLFLQGLNVLNTADEETKIMVKNEGLIHAKSSGVSAQHSGWGDVIVEHLKGEIIAGDEPNIIGTFLADVLKTRTAGILAVHQGSMPKTVEGKTFSASDSSTYDAKIGKIEITSKADITSKGDGILAYVKDVDDEGDAAAKMIIPVTIDVSGGTIMADGHGVYAETATTYTEMEAPMAGETMVTVGEMAMVRAKKDGVYVKGMRTFAASHARKGQYDQTVTINGKVMGGDGDYVGVRMMKGGTLVIGPKAKVEAASGTAVKSDGGLIITMKKDAVGRIGYVKGKMLNSGTTTFDGVKVDGEYTLSPGLETRGVYDVTRVTLKTIEGGHQFMDSGQAYHARARVYEALPSVLLEMSAPGGRQARLSATRDGGGVWARVLASDGEREADMSTTSMDDAGHDLSWDFERWGVETGFVISTDAPGVTLGVSAHYRDGEADVKRGGKIDASGMGVGLSATWRAEDGWYADGEFSYTRFEDIDLSSETRGMVRSGLDGDGHAIGVEVGRRMEMDGLAVIPRGGVTWSSVDIDDFDDVSGVAGSGRVEFSSEDSLKARVGVSLENGPTYASLDVEHEFSEDRAVMASGTRLESEVESTWARIGVGGVMTLDAQGESTLSADAHYAASGGDNHDYGASVLLKVRF